MSDAPGTAEPKQLPAHQPPRPATRKTKGDRVIAFPKTAKGADLMSDGPLAPFRTQIRPLLQLRDLHINLRAPQQEKPKAE